MTQLIGQKSPVPTNRTGASSEGRIHTQGAEGGLMGCQTRLTMNDTSKAEVGT